MATSYQHPDEPIYCYSFALQPEDVQPTGSCNFSRIDTTKMEFTLDGRVFTGPNGLAFVAPDYKLATTTFQSENPVNGSASVLVFANNWNVIRYKYGLGGKRFAN